MPPAGSDIAPASRTLQPTRRVRQTERSVEAYLKAGVLPRYMERARQIERDTAALRTQIERAYVRVRGRSYRRGPWTRPGS